MKAILALSVFLLGAAWSGVADSFLQVNGVFGPARKDKYSGWIPVSGFTSRGAPFKTTGTFLPLLTVLRSVDSVSPALALKCAEGTRISSAVMESTVTNRNGSGFFLQVRLTNLLVRSFQQAASVSSTPLTEQVDLASASIQWTYTALTTSRVAATGASPLAARVGEASADAPESNFHSTGTLLPGGVLRLEWTPVPGGRFRLMGSARLEGPFEFVRTLDAGDGGTRTAIEIPTSGPFQFFRVELE